MRFLRKRNQVRYILFLSIVLVAFLAAACIPESRALSSTEVVEASYLDLSANISDLRARIGEWQKGDENGQKVAEEKLERIEILLGAVGWPEAMSTAVSSTTNAVNPMAKALKEKDLAAAEVAAKAMGDASHDVTHSFYGDWMSEMHNVSFGPMTLHPAYLDLNANFSDLRARVTQWQNGDEASLNIAKEKAERIGVLLPHISGAGVSLKRLQIIEKELPKVVSALEKKDLPAAQRALKPINDASNDMTRDFYTWMGIASGSEDPACVQASYLDMTRQIAALRTSIALWQQGDEVGLTTAQETLARAEIVLAHPVWPEAMSAGVISTTKALQAAKQLIKDKDVKNVAGVEVVSKALGDASHEIIHEYYNRWLTGEVASQPSTPGGHGASSSGSHGAAPAQSQSAASTKPGVSPLVGTARTDTVSASSGGHKDDGHSAPVDSGPNWLVIGGFLLSIALVAATASVMKRMAAASAARSNHDLEPMQS